MLITYDIQAVQNYNWQISFKNTNVDLQQCFWLYIAFTRVFDLGILHPFLVQNISSLD